MLSPKIDQIDRNRDAATLQSDEEGKDAGRRTYSTREKTGLTLIVMSLALIAIGAAVKFFVERNMIRLPAQMTKELLSTPAYSFRVSHYVISLPPRSFNAYTLALIADGLAATICGIAGLILYFRNAKASDPVEMVEDDSEEENKGNEQLDIKQQPYPDIPTQIQTHPLFLKRKPPAEMPESSPPKEKGRRRSGNQGQQTEKESTPIKKEVKWEVNPPVVPLPPPTTTLGNDAIPPLPWPDPLNKRVLSPPKKTPEPPKTVPTPVNQMPAPVQGETTPVVDDWDEPTDSLSDSMARKQFIKLAKKMTSPRPPPPPPPPLPPPTPPTPPPKTDKNSPVAVNPATFANLMADIRKGNQLKSIPPKADDLEKLPSSFDSPQVELLLAKSRRLSQRIDVKGEGADEDAWKDKDT